MERYHDDDDAGWVWGAMPSRVERCICVCARASLGGVLRGPESGRPLSVMEVVAGDGGARQGSFEQGGEVVYCPKVMGHGFSSLPAAPFFCTFCCLWWWCDGRREKGQ